MRPYSHVFLPAFFAALVGCGRDTVVDPVDAPRPETAVARLPVEPVAPRDAVDQPEEDGKFTVVAMGDVMLDRQAEKAIARKGASYPFGGMKDFIEGHDVAFANLEAPISDRGEILAKGKKYSFRVDPAAGEAIPESGLDVVSIANNHAMDYGEDALEDTIMLLDGWKIAHAGAGQSLDEARRPARIVVEGTPVVFLAYCAWARSKMHAGEGTPGVAPIDADAIVEDVRKAKEEEGAVVIVSLHWGIQHTDRSQPGQHAVAHAIMEAGADAILGHHPHRPQEIEVVGGRPVAYSLGNLVFGYMNPLYTNNVALVLSFDGASLVSAALVPLAGKNGRIRYRPYPLSGPDGRRLLEKIAGFSERLGTVMDVSDSGAAIRLAAD